MVRSVFSDRRSAPILLGCRPSALKSLGRSQKSFQLFIKSSFCSLHQDINHSFKANNLLNLSCPRRYIRSGPDTIVFIAGDVARTVSIRLLKSCFSTSACRSLVSFTPACRTTAPMFSAPFGIEGMALCSDVENTSTRKTVTAHLTFGFASVDVADDGVSDDHGVTFRLAKRGEAVPRRDLEDRGRRRRRGPAPRPGLCLPLLKNPRSLV
ncbi:uncharacterized protein LOC125280136 [Megalobrama amblycephala]|uniref:uncharacterized protein LOC125280136 n=1 Tax=Megalobrama amblycephala TaxID=75352 RepID=UPI002013E327|nr:uncharacterized protein LOC125280136 [Megalobrama amblycephala]